MPHGITELFLKIHDGVHVAVLNITNYKCVI